MTQEEIYEKYPEMFIEKDLPETETCMCWGVCVPESCLPIIDTLCESFGHYWAGKGCKGSVVAEQIKMKFAELRFYYRLEFSEEATDEFKDYYRGHVDGCIAFATNLISKELEEG